MSICFSSDLPESILKGNNLLLNHSISLLGNRYRTLKLLGQAGSRTFLAIDERQTPLYCIVKQLLLDDLTHHQKVLTFHQTAKRLAELGEHSQVPSLLDAFEQGGKFFIVQE
jgi:serine/threonine protein kinase